MDKRSTSSLVFEWLLKVSVVFSLFSVFYNVYHLVDKINNDFWQVSFRIVLIIVFLTLGVLTLALRRKNFRTFAFFVVFIISFFKIITFTANYGFDIEIIPVYVLLIVVSLYLLYKASEHSSSYRRR